MRWLLLSRYFATVVFLARGRSISTNPQEYAVYARVAPADVARVDGGVVHGLTAATLLAGSRDWHHPIIPFATTPAARHHRGRTVPVDH
jgi:hypothetical protein